MNSDALYIRRGPKAERKMEHISIVESVLGKALPKGAVVHHIDGNGRNNQHDNLVVCENHRYHMLLYRRTRALNACGDPRGAKCRFCKEWVRSDNPDFYQIETAYEGPRSCHRSCNREYMRMYCRARKEARSA